MSLVTLHRSPDNMDLNERATLNYRKSYFESNSPVDSSASISSNSSNKQIDFDKEFNFRDLKEIYDENSALQRVSLSKKTTKVLKSTSHVKINLEANSKNLSSSNRQLFEKYFLVKDAALILPRRVNSSLNKPGISNSELLVSNSLTNDSVEQVKQEAESSSCAVNVDYDEFSSEPASNNLEQSSGDILVHLKSMVQLLRPNDTISVAVKLCSYHVDRARYLVVVETQSHRQNSECICEESAILGLDLQLDNNEKLNDDWLKKCLSSPTCSVGLVIPIYANCEISLNGDGGFKFKTHQSTHIFKPVSIQAMWSAYQYLNKTLENARKNNFYSVVSSSCLNNNMNLDTILLSHHESSSPAIPINHEWVKHYIAFIGKCKIEQQYLNEWYQKEDRSAQREEFTTPYFDQTCLTKEQEETGGKIKEKLKEIMISSKDDYGSMSSIHIRGILEKELQLNLDNFKKFVDVMIFQFYNQLVECASQILPFIYLGTEWNASNYESLVNDGITHILNVSSDVDNFFPDAFTYLNIRVRDVEETDLLKEFDRTNKFIQEVREQGTRCLVHCKMGVSRSASVVLAYLMKEYNYSLEQAFNFTKQKRTCINPNDGFRIQLATYESILNAHRSKYNLFEPVNSPCNENQGSELIVQPPQIQVTQSIDSNIDVIQEKYAPQVEIQSILSVKEAINKIKSMNSTETNQATASNISPPSSPIQSIKQIKSFKNLPPVQVKTEESTKPFDFQFIQPISTVYSQFALNKDFKSKNKSIPTINFDLPNSVNLKRATSHLTTQQELKNKPNVETYTTSSTSLNSPAIFTSEFSIVNYDHKTSENLSDSSGEQLSKETSKLTSHHRSKSTSSTLETLNLNKNVKELANEYMSKESRSLPSDFNFSNQFEIENVPTIKSTSYSLNSSNGLTDDDIQCSSDEKYVPIGIVKRQVESINFKSRPCTHNVNQSVLDEDNKDLAIEENKRLIDENSNSDIERNGFIKIEYLLDENKKSTNLEILTNSKSTNLFAELQNNNKQQQQQTITRSPDSKRFKCELLNIATSDKKIEADLDISRSKKVFEFLADKQRKQELDIRKNTEQSSNDNKKVLVLEIEIKPVVFNSDSINIDNEPESNSAPSIISSNLLLNMRSPNSNDITKCQAV